MPSRKARRWQHYQADREMRRVRKEIKRNRKPKRARRKNWMPDSFDDLDEMYDLPKSERVMPHGERERRRTLMAESLAALAEEKETEESESFAQELSGQQGLVVEVSSSLCRVDLGGNELVCGVRGSLSAEETGFTNVVAVGDQVIVSRNGSDRGVVEAVLPRKGVLSRPDAYHNGGRTVDRHRQQIIAANVDQLLVVASWREPHFWPELVDRYLIAAERNNLSPIICVNKVDLAEDLADCRAALQPYLELGYRVLFTSAMTGKGVGKLRKVLQGQTTVLAGMSGVGKSSLLLAVQPRLQLRTAEVSAHSGEGRHTTSQVNLIKLDGAGAVIDTPGIREFGLAGLRREELVRFYPEIAAVKPGCRFGNCSHTHEPGCTVKAAVRRGRVSATRYQSYRTIHGELPT
jgi:ribosome biogenesis GTPase